MGGGGVFFFTISKRVFGIQPILKKKLGLN